MAVTRDNNFLITGSRDKCVKKISIRDQQVVKDFGEVCSNPIKTIQLAPGDETLFIYNHKCNLKLIDLIDGRIIKDFGQCHNGGASGLQNMFVTRNGEYLFTSDKSGRFKQFSVRGRALVQDLGKIANSVYSLCD